MGLNKITEIKMGDVLGEVVSMNDRADLPAGCMEYTIWMDGSMHTVTHCIHH